MKIKVYPSVLSRDQMHFVDQLNTIDNADGAYLDIMDNHFVPNLTWGSPMVQVMVKSAALPVDAHLMIDNPDRWASEYAKTGYSIVSFHFEAAKVLLRTAEAIREPGVKLGIALNPAIPVSVLADILPCLDQVLLMSMGPGFGGQGFIPEVYPKIKRLRKMIGGARLSTDIGVDGDISDKNITKVVEAGTNIIIAGSFVFKREPIRAIAKLREIAVGVC